MNPTREEAELFELQRRIARSDRLAALGAMAARLAHELGTPLHSVGGHLELLLSEPGLPDPARERIAIVAREVDRLGRLIRLHLRQLRAGERAAHPTDINALVEGVAALMRPGVDAAGADLVLDLDPRATEPFVADALQIEQAVVNLLRNALDAIPRGGVITLRTQHAGSGRVLSVADTGSGVAADLRERVFEPFFSTKAPGSGSGLGLAICREIAQAHGGRIVLDSQPGVGTVVTLTLGPLEGGETA
jgi:signal transduction histidine kinase